MLAIDMARRDEKFVKLRKRIFLLVMCTLSGRRITEGCGYLSWIHSFIKVIEKLSALTRGVSSSSLVQHLISCKSPPSPPSLLNLNILRPLPTTPSSPSHWCCSQEVDRQKNTKIQQKTKTDRCGKQ